MIFVQNKNGCSMKRRPKVLMTVFFNEISETAMLTSFDYEISKTKNSSYDNSTNMIVI